MFCPSCGARITERAANCPFCSAVLPEAEGANVEGLEVAAPQVSVAPVQARRVSPHVELRLKFHGDGLTLLWIQLRNALLIVLTLGVYYFWAKAKQRQYLYSQTELEGDRFAYHGTGYELFLGWVKAACVLLPVFGVLTLLRLKAGVAGAVLSGLGFYAVLGALAPLVIVGTWRFRLSRTSWRAIRFAYRGSTKDFYREFLSAALWLVLTLGVYGLWMRARLRRHLAERTYFGSEKFQYNGSGGEVFGKAIVCGMLSLFTLGLSQIWFRAWLERYDWSHTSLGGAHFSSKVTFESLLGLYFVNALLFFFTLGIATPWIVVRSRRFHLEQLQLTGALDLARIEQRAMQASALGEEVGDLLDVGFLDMDLGL